MHWLSYKLLESPPASQWEEYSFKALLHWLHFFCAGVCHLVITPVLAVALFSKDKYRQHPKMSNYSFFTSVAWLRSRLKPLTTHIHTHSPHMKLKDEHMHRRQGTVWKHGGTQHKGIVGHFPRRSDARNVSLWNRYLKHTCTLGKWRQLVKYTVTERSNATS